MAFFLIVPIAALSSFRWASTESPWRNLDDDGIEVPSDHGEWVCIAFKFCRGHLLADASNTIRGTIRGVSLRKNLKMIGPTASLPRLGASEMIFTSDR